MFVFVAGKMCWMKSCLFLMNVQALFSLVTHDIHPNNITNILKSFVPQLHSQLYKGQMGRIGVIGGSIDYTGAPYYAGQSSLYFGGDLATIFTAKEALIPIKSYSPELMVTPLYSTEEIDHLEDNLIQSTISEKLNLYLPRLHSIVIGPGLGRHSKLLPNLSFSIQNITQLNIPLVIDADGLFMVSQNLNLVRGNKRCVLTPNINEFRMLVNRALEDLQWTLQANPEVESDRMKLSKLWCGELQNSDRAQILFQQLSSNSLPQQLKTLCVCLDGVTILLKGETDMLCGSLSNTPSTTSQLSCSSWDDSSVSDVFILHSHGGSSPRRCGGQGDILAGCVGVAVHWTNSLHSTSPKRSFLSLYDFTSNIFDKNNRINEIIFQEVSPMVQGCILASIVTKKASYLAYEKKGRSTTSPDVMEEIGKALEIVLGEVKDSDV